MIDVRSVIIGALLANVVLDVAAVAVAHNRQATEWRAPDWLRLAASTLLGVALLVALANLPPQQGG